jgi:hypothetical protein
MNMPGFTAENSLSKSNAHYQASQIMTNLIQGEALVYPAFISFRGCGLKECYMEVFGVEWACSRSGDYCYSFEL